MSEVERGEVSFMQGSNLKNLCSEFTNELDQFVRQRFRYVSKSARLGMSNTIDVRRVPVSLYLRFRPLAFWPTDSIVIARIEFSRERKGHGRALLQFFVDASATYGVRSIGLEQTHDGDNIQGFARKFGFLPYKNEDNWLVSIDTLREKLMEPAPLEN